MIGSLYNGGQDNTWLFSFDRSRPYSWTY